MKTIRHFLTLFFALLVSIGAFSQAPQGFNYQSAIRDAGGTILASTPVTMRFKLHNGSAGGTVEYTEVHSLTTNNFGLVNAVIGGGAVVSGDFSLLDWATTPYYLEVELDLGSGYVSMGSDALMSVPYALNAGNSPGWEVDGDDLQNTNPGLVNIGTPSWTPAGKLTVWNTGYPAGYAAEFVGEDVTNTNALVQMWNQGTGPTLNIDRANAIGDDLVTFKNFGADVASINTDGGAWLDGTVTVGTPAWTPVGKLNIWNTNNPTGSTLEILGSNATNTSPTVTMWNQGSGPTLQVDRASASGDKLINFQNYGGDVGYIRTDGGAWFNGNVGIGTSSPGAKLEVKGGYVFLNTSLDNSEGNTGVGFTGYNNVKLSVQSNQDYAFTSENLAGLNAGDFVGDVSVSGSLSKGGGSFKIDHPLDPENKYLYHSFVESPDMMNIYNGNVTTGADGIATVELPDYFEALNMEFRYQLTTIGVFAQAIVLEKVAGNSFKIQTDQPNVEVSWQVTGVRKDAWAQKNRIPTEIAKEDRAVGKYLHPRAFGLGDEMRINLRNPVKPEVK